jgi:predicted deacylase
VIAHFIDSVIFPLCDAAIDIHSAGTRGRWIPCAYLCKGNDAELNQRKLAITDAFGAPLTVVVGATGSSGSVDRAGADRHGIATISAELGGGEMNPETLALGSAGVYRVLRHLGILAADSADTATPPTRYVAFGDKAGSNQVLIPTSGLFEPYFTLGDMVKKGQAAGCIHPLEDVTQAGVEPKFPSDGLIVRRLTYAFVSRGLYYFTTAQEIPREEIV